MWENETEPFLSALRRVKRIDVDSESLSISAIRAM